MGGRIKSDAAPDGDARNLGNVRVDCHVVHGSTVAHQPGSTRASVRLQPIRDPGHGLGRHAHRALDGGWEYRSARFPRVVAVAPFIGA